MGWQTPEVVDPNVALADGRLYLLHTQFTLPNNTTRYLQLVCDRWPVVIHAFVLATAGAARDLRLQTQLGAVVSGGSPLDQRPMNRHGTAEPPFTSALDNVTVDTPGTPGLDLAISGEHRGLPAQMSAVAINEPHAAITTAITNLESGNAKVTLDLFAARAQASGRFLRQSDFLRQGDP